ncbi:cytochrome c peroxidase [Bradyrhizobium sp. DN5]|uniref:cytochrome-c peroxidase n=1 Tax=unclassified Bradyrhizobium TaxID=2631580 RepID=UPI000885B35C|nr:cytochrome c peroxidase [Bradyrhizobium sp. Rc2d]SDI17445.1 cytochrome c peroxidase [Bradyrhizobium sp. Rc2d]
MGASSMWCSRFRLAALIAAVAVGGLVAATFDVRGATDDLLAQAQQVFQPLPKDMATPEFPITPERVELGRTLFFDPRVSVDGTTSCARCHLPSLYGTDGLRKPHGAHDKINPRNAPTILNAALQFNAHWRGDRKNVEDQATQALISPTSFGNPDYASAMERMKTVSGYSEMFEKAFPGEQDPVTPENWGKAIGSYERTLVTPSRFDQFLSGDSQVLSTAEQRGLRTFLEIGCAACHNGPGVGGGTFQKFGVVEDYGNETKSAEIDKGRFDVTHDEADMYIFKVPILRNVKMTPPYFHDGSVNTLPEAVRIMAKLQLGKDLADQEIADVVAFLGSLTGELPDDFRNVPVLPASAFQSATDQTTRERR